MRLNLLAPILLLASPAAASQTDWQEVSPGVRMRLIADDVHRPDGTTIAGLEIDMPANTKTYWRVPGETGIPTVFDISASRGVHALSAVWPYPVIDRAAGYTDYVYYGPTVLPLRLQISGDTPLLDASVTLGICSDVCVPVTAKFAMPLHLGKTDVTQEIRLQQARALAPVPWSGPGDALGEARWDAADQELEVAVNTMEVDPSSLIVDAGDPGILFGAPQKSPDGQVVALPLLGGDAAGLEGKPVQLIFLTPTGAYELTRTIGAGAAAAPQH
jgi:DsbC/DsbD-like thiol-disulfide interchange protein